MRILKRIHQAAYRAPHERIIVKRLVDILILQNVPGFPEGRDQLLTIRLIIRRNIISGGDLRKSELKRRSLS